MICTVLTFCRRDSQAQQEFELAVGLQPWFSRAYTALGLAGERQGRIAEAIASFNRALAIDANDFAALLNRGNAQLMLNEWDKVRQDLERAARFEPDSAEVHQAMGAMFFYRGDLDAAMKEYRRAI